MKLRNAASGAKFLVAGTVLFLSPVFLNPLVELAYKYKDSSTCKPMGNQVMHSSSSPSRKNTLTRQEFEKNSPYKYVTVKLGGVDFFCLSIL